MNRLAAYQGTAGAFGEEACKAFLPDYTPLPLDSFAEVADAVANGRAERGALPLMNNSAGEVPGTRALIASRGLTVLAERSLRVRIHLLALAGASVEALRTVVSHPMALAQCRRFIAEHGLATEADTNTALAARALARSGDLTRGVLASAHAAEQFGLAILCRDVHDRPDNATIFAIVARPAER